MVIDQSVTVGLRVVLMKPHLSPKERLQNSAASALVILKLSPWNRPLGKMALSSASMWLKIRDSLVRFLLRTRTDEESEAQTWSDRKHLVPGQRSEEQEVFVIVTL